MTVGAEITSQAQDAGLLLSRRGEHIHVESPLGRPLPEDLRRRLVKHKREVLAWLDFCAAADELLLACSERLMRACPAGLPLDAERWHAAEAELHHAHRSQDLEVFRSAVATYERFACEQFQRSQHKER